MYITPKQQILCA